MKKLSCMISGLHGFVGTHLTRKLQSDGYDVVPISRNILYNERKLTKYIRGYKPTYIFHLASYGNRDYQDEERKIIKANIQGTVNLLYASQEVAYRAFINVGSSSEYGIKNRPMRETDLPETDSFYGATKVAATYLCRAFAKKYNKPLFTVRPFSLYGPDEPKEKFIPTLIRCLKSHRQLQLFSGVHDWIYIDDFLDALMVCAKNAKTLKGQVVNVGTGKQVTNEEIVTMVERITGKKILCRRNNAFIRSYDTSVSWVADNRLLRSFGWRPRYSIVKGLTEILND